MAIIQGARTSRNTNQNQNIIDMSKKIYMLDPDATPFTSLLMQTGKEQATQPKFEWLEDKSLVRYSKITTAESDTTETELVVEDNTLFIPDLVCKIMTTGEVVRVVSVGTDNKITVKRGWGTTSAAAITKDAAIVILGLAAGEGTGAPTAQTTNLTNVFNYCQIFKNTVKTTGTRQAMALYGVDSKGDQAYQRAKVGKDHMKDIERAFLLGEKKEDLTGTEPVRSTGGLLSFITSNVTEITTALTQEAFNSFLETAFKYGSSNKIMLASSIILNALNKWGTAQFQGTTQAESMLGVVITKYRTNYGTLAVSHYKPFAEYGMGGYGIVLDMSEIKMKVLRDTNLNLNVQNNDVDGQTDQYLTEAGLKVQNEEKHAVIKGISTIA